MRRCGSGEAQPLWGLDGVAAACGMAATRPTNRRMTWRQRVLMRDDSRGRMASGMYAGSAEKAVLDSVRRNRPLSALADAERTLVVMLLSVPVFMRQRATWAGRGSVGARREGSRRRSWRHRSAGRRRWVLTVATGRCRAHCGVRSRRERRAAVRGPGRDARGVRHWPEARSGGYA